MSENKITYISDEAKREAETIYIDAAINAAVAGFLKGEPIKDILSKINDGSKKFNGWVYDKNAFQNEEYAWLISEEEIFHTDEDIFDYYDREVLDLKTDKAILEFMDNTINDKCHDRTAYHYELYNGVYIFERI